jgi:hypothetical protein
MDVVPAGAVSGTLRTGGELHAFARHLDQGVGAINADLVVDERAEVRQDCLMVHQRSEITMNIEEPPERAIPLVTV